MQITSRTIDDVTIVEVDGELDAQTAGEAQDGILLLAEPGSRLILDMSRVPFMSSAGLRMFLVLYRTIRGRGGAIAIAGLSEDLRNTMAATGFLSLFQHHCNLETALADLGATRMGA